MVIFLCLGMTMYHNGLETRENNIWIKDKSQPPSVFLHRAGGLWVIVRRAKQVSEFLSSNLNTSISRTQRQYVISIICIVFQILMP